ncbi:MAG: O-antigen ligase family protein [Sandaracinaceae bacterium]
MFPWGVAIIAGFSGVACLAAAWAAREDGTKAPLGWVGIAGLGVWGWTALQALPLPRFLTGWLQPEAVEMADGAALLLEEPTRGWIPLSMAPGSTVLALVQGAALIAAFVAATTLVALGHRRRALVMVGLSGVVMALVALLHRAVGADRVFGIYEPIHGTSPLLAPLVNQNSLSGFLSMCAPVLIGLGLDREEPPQRWGWTTAGVLTATCALLAVSRGGVASLGVGFLALGIFGAFRRRRERGKAFGSSLILLGAAFATAVGLGLYLAAEAIYRDFETGGFEKLTLARLSLDLSLDHPIVGVGRGAFSAAFVSRMGSVTRATNPENLIAQWTTEWGIPVSLGLIALLAWSIVRGTRRAKSWAHLGGAAGLVAIFVHDLVDFSLELTGVGVVAAGLAGAVLAPSRRRRSARARVTIPRAGLAAGALAVALVAVLGWGLDRYSVHGMQTALEAQMRASHHEDFRSTVVDAVRRHPSEPTFPLLAGSEAAQRGDTSALRWLNRSMALAPGWAAPHEEAARYLLRVGRASQALLEMREAGERGTPNAARLACPVLEDHPELVPVAIRALGEDEVGDELVDRVGGCLDRHSDASRAIDDHLVEQDVLGGRVRAARRHVDDGHPREALALLDGLDTADPRVVRLRARAHLAADDPARAIAALADADTAAPNLELLARAQAAARDEAGMLETLTRLRGLSAGHVSEIARARVLEGELQESLGNDFAALRAYGRAERLDPDSQGLVNAARVAERVGDLGRAYRAHNDLCQRNGGRSPHCRARDRLLQELGESRRRAEQPLGARLD